MVVLSLTIMVFVL